MKIYTKTGDLGKTSLFGGDRVSKSNLRVDTYGNFDELNSYVGWLNEIVVLSDIKTHLIAIQNNLFLIGSHIATVDKNAIKKLTAIDPNWIELIERNIDELNEELPQMTHFILPGGTEETSRAHICRTVCRRAERSLVHIIDNDTSLDDNFKNILIYTNRLSDYFFVLARYFTYKSNQKDVIWSQNSHN